MIYHASRDGYLIVRQYDEYADGTPAVVMSHPELPGCFTYGDPADDEAVVASLDAARRAYIAVSRRKGYPVPEPTVNAATTATFLTL